mmetsp:Transcript_6259/g.13753  ORF Transcript_6259/g.13753 Transcript_6259/m.13753 type:complete len:90 (-) Transcript_6259:1330-1599(-)
MNKHLPIRLIDEKLSMTTPSKIYLRPITFYSASSLRRATENSANPYQHPPSQPLQIQQLLTGINLLHCHLLHIFQLRLGGTQLKQNVET